jgi:hypothetical protein
VPERLGEERTYGTDFGERAFAIGDTLVGRQRAHGGAANATRSFPIMTMGGSS